MPWIHDGLPIMGEDIHSHPISRPERLCRAKDQAFHLCIAPTSSFHFNPFGARLGLCISDQARRVGLAWPGAYALAQLLLGFRSGLDFQL